DVLSSGFVQRPVERLAARRTVAVLPRVTVRHVERGDPIVGRRARELLGGGCGVSAAQRALGLTHKSAAERAELVGPAVGVVAADPANRRETLADACASHRSDAEATQRLEIEVATRTFRAELDLHGSLLFAKDSLDDVKEPGAVSREGRVVWI